jgi:hypothetical protein
MIKLESGAKVPVRLHTGEAVYDHMYHEGEREISVGSQSYCATDKFYDGSCVRFVGPACDLVTVGVNV